jgi:hypothetical protein
MPIDQASYAVAQPELTAGETLLWEGQPSASIIFRKEDVFLIPFSLLWGGFAIFWEAGVSGYWGNGLKHNAPSYFVMLWGMPFVLIGQYLIWGRFLFTAWKKRRTHYAITNRRALVVQDSWRRKMASAYLDTLPALIKENSSNGMGRLRFATSEPIWSRRNGWSAWDGMSVENVPVFRDIEDVDSVYRLVSEQRERLRDADKIPT